MALTPDMIENDLALALFRYSYGRLTIADAEKKAKEVAPNLIKNIDKFGHKCLTWYAQQLLAVM